MNMTLNNEKGDGIAIVVYGVTLMLVFVFLAINLLNGKIIENGYNSLRDSIQSAATGSVIHLLTTTNADNMTQEQSTQINKTQDNSGNVVAPYDLYLQLALGYIINRTQDPNVVSNPKEDNVVVQTGNVNNFIKLDHKKVVSSTLALLEDSVIRGKKVVGGSSTTLPIYNTDYFKVLMMFIEPLYNNEYEKYFNIIVYGNGDVSRAADGSLILQGKTYPAGASTGNMTDVYNNINTVIKGIVNRADPTGTTVDYGIDSTISIHLTDGNSTSGEELMRKMETKPYYLIVVKDFALPTLFQNVYTDTDVAGNRNTNIFRGAFEAISGNGRLKTPIVALNSAKIERKLGGSDR